MPVERMAGSASLVDVLDRVLDRGLRWDAEAHPAQLRPSPPGGPAHIVVTHIDVRTHDLPHRGAPPRENAPGA